MSYPRIFATPGVGDFAEDVDTERQRQLKQWGDQHHPDGTGEPNDQLLAEYFRSVCKSAHAAGKDTWRNIALEEMYEVVAETDWARLRVELIQLSAVLAAWISDGDRRELARWMADSGQEDGSAHE